MVAALRPHVTQCHCFAHSEQICFLTNHERLYLKQLQQNYICQASETKCTLYIEVVLFLFNSVFWLFSHLALISGLFTETNNLLNKAPKPLSATSLYCESTQDWEVTQLVLPSLLQMCVDPRSPSGPTTTSCGLPARLHTAAQMCCFQAFSPRLQSCEGCELSLLCCRLVFDWYHVSA